MSEQERKKQTTKLMIERKKNWHRARSIRKDDSLRKGDKICLKYLGDGVMGSDVGDLVQANEHDLIITKYQGKNNTDFHLKIILI